MKLYLYNKDGQYICVKLGSVYIFVRYKTIIIIYPNITYFIVNLETIKVYKKIIISQRFYKNYLKYNTN